MAGVGARYVDCVDAAELVRRALAKAFPEGRFTVHAHREGSLAFWPTIDISWTGGPDEPAVRALTDGFVGYAIELSDDLDLTPIPVPVPRDDPDGNGLVQYDVFRIDLHHD